MKTETSCGLRNVKMVSSLQLSSERERVHYWKPLYNKCSDYVECPRCWPGVH